MEFDLEILVHCSVHQAFEICSNPEHQLQWMDSLVNVEVDETKAPSIGSGFRQIHEISGVRQVFEGVLLDLQPGERISTKLAHPDFTMFTDIRFEEVGEQCRISQHCQMELHSMALKLIRGGVKSAVGKRLEEDFERLRVMLEAA